jgi:hypothetical protein
MCGNCRVDILDPPAAPLESRLDPAIRLADAVGPLGSGQLTPHQIEAGLECSPAPRPR